MKRLNIVLCAIFFTLLVSDVSSDHAIKDHGTGRLANMFRHQNSRWAPHEQLLSNEEPRDTLMNRIKRRIPLVSNVNKGGLVDKVSRYSPNAKGIREMVESGEDMIGDQYKNAKNKMSDATEYVRSKIPHGDSTNQQHHWMHLPFQKHEESKTPVEKIGHAAGDIGHKMRDLSTEAMGRTRHMIGLGKNQHRDDGSSNQESVAMDNEYDEDHIDGQGSYLSNVGEKIRHGAGESYRATTEMMKHKARENKQALKHQAERLGIHSDDVTKYLGDRAHQISHITDQPNVLKRYYGMLTRRFIDVGRAMEDKAQQLSESDIRYYEFASGMQRTMDKQLENLWNERMNMAKVAFDEARHEMHTLGQKGGDTRAIVKTSMRAIRQLEREMEKQKFKLAFVLKQIENEC